MTDALDDESAAELRSALSDHAYTAAAIARVINTLTGLRVSETTVRGWRRGDRPT